jgi:hypothetical protein
MENSSNEIQSAAIPCPVILKMQNSARSTGHKSSTKVGDCRRKFESAGLLQEV